MAYSNQHIDYDIKAIESNKILKATRTRLKKMLYHLKNGITLDQAKQTIAERYGKLNWLQVKYDYEYGIGLEKLISFEMLMNEVADVYKNGK